MRKAGTLSTKSKPVAVLTSDVHYDIKTLTVADSCMRKAITTAEELDVPLIIAGDLHETKANLRGECTNAMLKTFSEARCEINLIIGNHDKINEKSKEHALNFLEPHCNFIINEPRKFSFENGQKFYLIPYYHDITELRVYLKTLPKGALLIMHQGLNGSKAGEYFNDKSALNKEDVKDFRVISGHYHCRQQIITCDPMKELRVGKMNGLIGVWDFIGNSYTQDFSEANDPEKGYQILFDDGTLEFIPTHERKHIKIELDVEDESPDIEPGNILWVVVRGPSDTLSTVTKESLQLPQPFRLELISTDEVMPGEATKKLDFDDVIDAASIDKARKPRLKELWKELVSEDQAS